MVVLERETLFEALVLKVCKDAFPLEATEYQMYKLTTQGTSQSLPASWYYIIQERKRNGVQMYAGPVCPLIMRP